MVNFSLFFWFLNFYKLFTRFPFTSKRVKYHPFLDLQFLVIFYAFIWFFLMFYSLQKESKRPFLGLQILLIFVIFSWFSRSKKLYFWLFFVFIKPNELFFFYFFSWTFLIFPHFWFTSKRVKKAPFFRPPICDRFSPFFDFFIFYWIFFIFFWFFLAFLVFGQFWPFSQKPQKVPKTPFVTSICREMVKNSDFWPLFGPPDRGRFGPLFGPYFWTFFKFFNFFGFFKFF